VPLEALPELAAGINAMLPPNYNHNHNLNSSLSSLSSSASSSSAAASLATAAAAPSAPDNAVLLRSLDLSGNPCLFGPSTLHHQQQSSQPSQPSQEAEAEGAVWGEEYQHLLAFFDTAAGAFGYMRACASPPLPSHLISPPTNHNPSTHTINSNRYQAISAIQGPAALTRGVLRALLAAPGCQHLTTLGLGGAPAGAPEFYFVEVIIERLPVPRR
jgi:hypothetical protein